MILATKNLDLTGYNSSLIIRTDSVEKYLDSIRNYPLLSSSESLRLLKLAQGGDMDAFGKLVACNQRFVYGVAKRYTRGDMLLDLVNEGNLGLMKAIEKFDIEKDNTFLTYAVWHIRSKINMFLINNGAIVRKTNNSKTTFFCKKSQNRFFAENGRYPTEDEMLEIFEEEYGIKITDKKDLYDLKTSYLDAPVDDNNDETFSNTEAYNTRTASYNDYEDTIEKEDLKRRLKISLNALTERDREIVKKAFGIDYDREYSNFEIGEELGMTAERVRQIKKACCEKMKRVYCKIK